MKIYKLPRLHVNRIYIQTCNNIITHITHAIMEIDLSEAASATNTASHSEATLKDRGYNSIIHILREAKSSELTEHNQYNRLCPICLFIISHEMQDDPVKINKTNNYIRSIRERKDMPFSPASICATISVLLVLDFSELGYKIVDKSVDMLSAEDECNYKVPKNEFVKYINLHLYNCESTLNFKQTKIQKMALDQLSESVEAGDVPINNLITLIKQPITNNSTRM